MKTRSGLLGIASALISLAALGETCPLDQIQRVNAEPVDYLLRAYAKTIKRPPEHRLGAGAHDSEMYLRHQSPDRTEMSGRAFGPGRGGGHLIVIGNQSYARLEGNGWLSLPPGMPGPGAGNGHQQYGPAALVQALAGSHNRRIGLGPCPDDTDCVRYRSMDDGHPGTLFFSAKTCRLVASIGSDANGPKSIFVGYGPQRVQAPENAASLADNPMAMLQLLGGTGSRSSSRTQSRSGSPSRRAEPAPATRGPKKLSHYLMLHQEAYTMAVEGYAQLGPYLLFLIGDGASAPSSPLYPDTVKENSMRVSASAVASSERAADAAASGKLAGSRQNTQGDRAAELGVMNVGTPSDMYSVWMDDTGDGVDQLDFAPGNVTVLRGAQDRAAIAIKAKLAKGAQSRVALARALVAEPTVLVIDEPTSALDEETAQKVSRLVDSLGDRQLLVTVHSAAASAVDHLQTELMLLGAPGDQLTTVSFGALLPTCRDASVACAEDNRRAEIRILRDPD